MNYTEKILHQSNYWYNDGLRKAQIRDMSGAITSLRKSLQWLLYTDMIQAEGKIYFAPGTANQILVYDYAQHSFSYIFLEYADKTPKRTLKFVRIYAEGNELYLIPKEYPCIVRINTKTGGQEHLHVADLSEKVEKENDVKPPKIENERSILFASGHGQDQLYISYHKMMGLYSDGDAEVIHADRKGNIRKCYKADC